MKCPKCGFARPLSDQVCRRCKYVFDEDRFLSLTPPRSADGPSRHKIHDPRFGAILERLRSSAWIPPAASLVPGVGHVLQGKPWLGILYFVLTVFLFSMSVAFFSQTSGQMLFGLALSTHASCILDTTPWGRAPKATPRILAMAGILVGLLFLYWPLVVQLANRLVSPERRQMDRGLGAPIAALGIEQIIIMLVLFAASTAFSTWISRRLSSRDS